MIRRIPADADHEYAGRLVLYVPEPDAGFLHEPLAEIRPGAYLIGGAS